ncbi:NAD-dependent epimerase/dehydratase family protein [Endozoicomonas euniceicola]|uniref:NAD(P)H-binding protein n=1 Tax=Endozoicomonas euniceicola TaxID=1234143 RepID=A0ABY6H3B2_9GAMM|nr:NAD(P)H-binding protein [Endozoicomonas euniceicola]UYM18718.1 NAD(P)H-binding protein [Endozoicomonas euniceicola]
MSSKSRISIVGYGRVGLPLAKALKEKGYDVTGTVTGSEKRDKLVAEGLDTHILSFDPQPQGNLAAAMEADVLVITIPPSMRAPQDYPAILESLADAAANSGIKKVLFVATTSVYPQTGDEVREEDATHEASPFLGFSWLPLEETFTQRDEFTTTVVRFSGLMGGGINPGMYFAGRELKGANDPVNMIHIDDCVGAIAAIIEQDVWGEAFNASADEHPRKRDFYTKACASAGIPAPVFSDEPSPYRIVNCDKLKQRLGYVFKHSDPLAALDS